MGGGGGGGGQKGKKRKKKGKTRKGAVTEYFRIILESRVRHSDPEFSGKEL